MHEKIKNEKTAKTEFDKRIKEIAPLLLDIFKKSNESYKNNQSKENTYIKDAEFKQTMKTLRSFTSESEIGGMLFRPRIKMSSLGQYPMNSSKKWTLPALIPRPLPKTLKNRFHTTTIKKDNLRSPWAEVVSF